MPCDCRMFTFLQIGCSLVFRGDMDVGSDGTLVRTFYYHSIMALHQKSRITQHKRLWQNVSACQCLSKYKRHSILPFWSLFVSTKRVNMFYDNAIFYFLWFFFSILERFLLIFDRISLIFDHFYHQFFVDFWTGFIDFKPIFIDFRPFFYRFQTNSIDFVDWSQSKYKRHSILPVWKPLFAITQRVIFNCMTKHFVIEFELS